MAKKHTNRLDAIWPSHSDNGSESVLPDAKQIAAKIEPMIQNIGATIADYPRASLTMAATLGAVLGWFIKRN